MKVRSLAVAVSLLPLIACQYSPDTATRTISYNQSISQSTNDLFLLNIMRARMRAPTYYTRNQSNNTTSTFNPSITSTISPAIGSTVTTEVTKNFGATSGAAGFARTFQLTKAAAASTLSLVPGLSATETNQLTLANLDDQGSMNGLLTPVTVTQLNNYVRQGFNGEEMALLTIGRFNISMPLLRALPDVVSEVCAVKRQSYEGDLENGYMHDEPYCAYLFDGIKYTTFMYSAGDINILYPNPGPNVFLVKYTNTDHPIDIPGKIDAICFAGGLISPDGPQAVIDTFETAKSAEKAAKDAREAEEKRTGKKADQPGAPPDEQASLYNDPAVDPRVAILNSHHNPIGSKPASLNSQSCFAEVVTVLLALDLHPIDGSPTALYRAPIEMVEDNPRYLSDLTQQKLKVAFLYEGAPKDRKDEKWDDQDAPGDPFKKPSEIGVCKAADDMAIAFEGDGYVTARIGLGDSDPLFSRKVDDEKTYANARTGSRESNASKSPTFTPPKGSTHSELSVGSQKAPVGSIAFLPLQLPTAIQLKKGNDDSDEDGDGCQMAVKEWEDADDSNSLTLEYAPRSLEGIVYYLGQVLRRRYDTPSNPTPVGFVNWGSANGVSYIYQETLFDAEPGHKPGHAIAEAADESGAFNVPDLCDPATNLSHERICSIEFPNHASAQVFTLLNQLWGLNKTQATTPAIPTVDVISH